MILSRLRLPVAEHLMHPAIKINKQTKGSEGSEESEERKNTY